MASIEEVKKLIYCNIEDKKGDKISTKVTNCIQQDISLLSFFIGFPL